MAAGDPASIRLFVAISTTRLGVFRICCGIQIATASLVANGSGRSGTGIRRR
jgi:hypothetical protein